jgi:hypothetical protein
MRRGSRNANARAGGLRLMTLGFIVASGGAGIAILAATARDAMSHEVALALARTAVWMGWFAMLGGASAMVIGLLMNLISALRPKE